MNVLTSVNSLNLIFIDDCSVNNYRPIIHFRPIILRYEIIVGQINYNLMIKVISNQLFNQSTLFF